MRIPFFSVFVTNSIITCGLGPEARQPWLHREAKTQGITGTMGSRDGPPGPLGPRGPEGLNEDESLYKLDNFLGK